MEQPVAQPVGKVPERQEAQDWCADVATAQHILRPAGRVHEDDAGSGDRRQVTVTAQLVDDVDRQQATHRTADEDELVVTDVDTQAHDDGLDDVVCVELVSGVGDGHDVAVREPGLHQRLRGVLAVSDEAGQVDDQRRVLIAVMLGQLDLRLHEQGAVQVGHDHQGHQDGDDPQPPGHVKHLFPCVHGDLVTRVRVV